MRFLSQQKLIGLLMLCLFSSFLHASPVVVELMKKAMRDNQPYLSGLIKETMENNPEILAAHDRWIAETYVPSQARALPDPALNGGYLNLAGSNPLEDDLQGLEILGATQAIPFPGKLYYRGKIANIAVTKAEAEYHARSLVIISHLKRLYYDLYFVNQARLIFEKNQAILHHMEGLADEKNKAGLAPEQDKLRAKTEIARFSKRLIRLEQEHYSLVADINNIINRPSLDTPIRTPEKLPITIFHHKAEELNELIRKRSPELRASRKEVDKRKTSINLSRMDYFSDIELEGDKLHDKKLDADGYQLLLKVTVPLYFKAKQEKAVRESKTRYQAEMQDFQDLYQNLMFRVKNAFFITGRTEKVMKLLKKDIIPNATLTLDSSETAYQANQVDFLTMLNNLLTLQINQLDLQREMVQHEKAITEIEEVIGVFA